MEINFSVNYIDMFSRDNITSQIFSKDEIIPDCKAFSSLTGNFSGSLTNFNTTAVVAFMENSDVFEPFFYLIDISFHFKYFFKLIRISFILDNVGLIGE